MNHGAIETKYAGHKFRSRLEARWAVFFDELEMEWQYEPQGFESGGARYLPDFFLPKVGNGQFVEVKGDPNGLRNDFDRLKILLGPDSPIPNYLSSGLVVLGEIPNAPGLTTFHPVIKWSEEHGIHRLWTVFLKIVGDDFYTMGDTQFGILEQLCRVEADPNMQAGSDCGGWTVESRSVATPLVLGRINAAYESARHARFEHRQSGAR